MKILLAVDGSSGSEGAVRQVLARPWPADSAVKRLAVVELLTTVTPENFWVPSSYYLRLEQALQTQARNAIERAQAQFHAAQNQLTVTTETLHGVAKEVIVEEAEPWGADWMVVGSHGYRGLQKLWFGSVSQAVAAHAHCSVEIVRADGDGRKGALS